MSVHRVVKRKEPPRSQCRAKNPTFFHVLSRLTYTRPSDSCALWTCATGTHPKLKHHKSKSVQTPNGRILSWKSRRLHPPPFPLPPPRSVPVPPPSFIAQEAHPFPSRTVVYADSLSHTDTVALPTCLADGVPPSGCPNVPTFFILHFSFVICGLVFFFQPHSQSHHSSQSCAHAPQRSP